MKDMFLDIVANLIVFIAILPFALLMLPIFVLYIVVVVPLEWAAKRIKWDLGVRL